MSDHVEEPKRFEPKTPVQLDPPKDDPISVDYLKKCDGKTALWERLKLKLVSVLK
jgi:hypothetical protein